MTEHREPPPAFLEFLRTQGYTKYILREDMPAWWRKEGGAPMPWDEVPVAIAAERDAALVELTKLRVQGGPKLKTGFLSSEFILSAGGLIATALVASQGQLLELAESLGPTWGKVINVVLAVAVAAVGGRYVAKRSAEKLNAAEAKKDA